MIKTYNDICNILDEVVSLSNGSELTTHEKDGLNGLRIWGHRIQLPRNESENIYFLLPYSNSTIGIELLQSFGSEKYFIIDCFKKFVSNDRAVEPRLFFMTFLFNSKGYNDFFNNSSTFKDIQRLYTKRTVTFFNDEDALENNNTLTLENLLQAWQTKGKSSLLIIGERGIGKSWTVLNYCRNNYKLHRENPWDNPLPIYLNLRGLSENIPGITNLGELIFYHLINQYDIKIFGGYFLYSALLKAGKIILVFDGLDEMSKEVSKELTIKNIWQVFSVYSNTSKFILTSRINFFQSRIQIREHFSYKSFLDFKRGNTYYKNDIYNEEERRVRQDFNIWEISPLQNDEKIKLLEKASSLEDEQLNKGLDKLIKISKFEEETIHHELSRLLEIPGYFLPIVRLLAANRPIPLIEIYEQSINSVVIEFNIESDRAIDKYRTIDRYKNIEGKIFGASKKNEILRKLAWYMIERDTLEFDIIEFPKFIRDIDDIDFDIVLNDLQTQTVITLKEEGKYSFITTNIFSFYVANHLFLLLTSQNENDVKKGIQNLGKHDLTEGEILSKAKLFLSAKIDSLFQDAGNSILRNIIEKVESAFRRDRPYSPWLKYLTSNLKLIGIECNQEVLNKFDFWNKNPISNQVNKTDKKMVLIPGNEFIKPFFLGVTEVTNKDFFEFLDSNEFDDNNQECLGRYWKRQEVFGRDTNMENPYVEIINYYHLIFWTDDKIPKGKQDHPIVWVGWFAAAKFCNWLSMVENLEPYYTFELVNNKFSKLIVNETSFGYRLPSEIEWRFSASGGDLSARTILDIYTDEKEKERIRRKFFMEEADTTSPVKSENPNKFGVYGLMGNVREWVDDSEKKVLNRYDEQIIKGMGWLLGKEGFEFSHSSPLIAQNNNVDVGFRIARSLSKEEEEKVRAGYLKFK